MLESRYRHFVDNGKPLCGRHIREVKHTAAFTGNVTCPGCRAEIKRRTGIGSGAPYRLPSGDYFPLISDPAYCAELMARYRAGERAPAGSVAHD